MVQVSLYIIKQVILKIILHSIQECFSALNIKAGRVKPNSY